uniref:Uncharacterized protein n=1 Tax=Timema poppense TaxID=170557 RepID=A0A7R9GXA3_TIMPO|nr:unnamed protein product [Timema poppensis]
MKNHPSFTRARLEPRSPSPSLAHHETSALANYASEAAFDRSFAYINASFKNMSIQTIPFLIPELLPSRTEKKSRDVLSRDRHDDHFVIYKKPRDSRSAFKPSLVDEIRCRVETKETRRKKVVFSREHV